MSSNPLAVSVHLWQTGVAISTPTAPVPARDVRRRAPSRRAGQQPRADAVRRAARPCSATPSTRRMTVRTGPASRSRSGSRPPSRDSRCTRPRERAVKCLRCRRDTWEVHALCVDCGPGACDTCTPAESDVLAPAVTA